MSKEKNEVINVTINVKEIANAARNATNLDDLALEIETLNPRDIKLEQDIYTLKSKPWDDKAKGKKKEFAPKVVGIKSFMVDSLTTKAKEGYVTINGVIDVPKEGRRVVKLEECLFATEDNARAVARVLTEIELERAQEMADEANRAVDAIKTQLANDRF